MPDNAGYVNLERKTGLRAVADRAAPAPPVAPVTTYENWSAGEAVVTPR